MTSVKDWIWWLVTYVVHFTLAYSVAAYMEQDYAKYLAAISLGLAVMNGIKISRQEANP